MAINSKDIEALWKRYSDEGVKKGISVVQFFESNGVPYHTFEKWYKKKFSEKGIVDCVVGGLPDGTVQIPDSEKPLTLKPEKRNDVYVSYANIKGKRKRALNIAGAKACDKRDWMLTVVSDS